MGLVAILYVFAIFQDFITPFVMYFVVFTVGFHLYFIYLMIFESNRNLAKSMRNTGFIYPLCSVLSLALVLPLAENPGLLTLGVLILIWTCDSMAYLVGRKIGITKLFERVSPKKTWEGIYGAIVGTILISLMMYPLFQLYSFSFWVILAVIVVIFGTFGDLIQSHIKRQFGVKDSGNLMPGHGGFWDRFDSFVFLLPFVSLLILLYS
jgi:phosphatidate cytidylyltransferase